MIGYVIILSILAVLFLFAALFLLRRCQYLYDKNVELTDMYEALLIREKKTNIDKKNTYIHLAQKTKMLVNNTYVVDSIFTILNDKKRDARSAVEQYIRRGKDGKSDYLNGIREVAEFKAPGAIKAIKRAYPELTEEDIDLYCMTYLGVAVSTICFVLDCSSAYMYNKKCLLRKRLEIYDSKFSLKKHFEQVVERYHKTMGIKVK